MATVQTYSQTITNFQNTFIPYLQNNWNFHNLISQSNYQILTIDQNDTIGIKYKTGSAGIEDAYIAVYFKGVEYHKTTFYPNIAMQIEITDTALILSYANDSSVGPNNCEKIIIHNAFNSTTNTTEQVISYMGSKSSSNVSAIYASDVLTPADISEQNGNANVSSKYTALINLYNSKSNFVATDVYKSMFMELSAWSFGDVMLNGHRYRMSGSIFVLDE